MEPVNLPKVNERDFVIQRVKGLFNLHISKLSREMSLGYEDTFEAHSLCILMLIGKYEGTLDSFPKMVLNTLNLLGVEHELTLGEKLYILSHALSSDASYVVRWERENVNPEDSVSEDNS
jgi:hypothetical protein